MIASGKDCLLIIEVKIYCPGWSMVDNRGSWFCTGWQEDKLPGRDDYTMQEKEDSEANGAGRAANKHVCSIID